jgi:hypothetical protein
MLFSIMTANAIWVAAACFLQGEQVPALAASLQKITMAVFAFTFLIRLLEFTDMLIGFFGAVRPRYGCSTLAPLLVSCVFSRQSK